MRKLNTLLFVCFALLLASTVRAQTSGVNNAQLNGDYAFTFNGFNVGAGGSSVFATVGRFSADGAGNVTNGEMDTNGVGPAAVLTAQTFTGAYAIGADNRGVMTLNTQGGSARLAFAMMPNGNAQFIKFDAAGGTGTVGSGTIEKVDTTAYNTANITGDYAFGVAGFDASNNRAAFAGRLTANGAGAFTNGAADIGQFGTTSSVIFTTANYAVSDTTRGRGAINLASLIGGASRNFDFVFYVVNAGKLFAMETDGVTGSTPLLNGVVLQQQTPAGGFSNASLNGDMVLYLTARSMCGSGSVPVAIVLVGLLTAGGNGALSLTFDQNCGGATNSVTALLGTYIVATNGRSTMMIGQYNTVAYLVSANQAFFLGTDSSGFVDPQAAGSLTNSAVQGTYAGSAISPATSNVAIFSGEFTADGASPTGNITGIEDIGASSGPVSGSAFNATYSISSSPTNGRGTMTITSGSGGSAVVYVVSPSKFVVVPLNDPNPAVWIFEGSSLPSTLSSLALDPTSVVGGVQSSTGTVTLSGPAPAGDAQVLLSSSNTAVASVPSSVTVPAGATSATFTVTTSTVAASTSVTISASYGGVSKTAALTVTPSAPPPLSSLALNPASVVGGAQSSTGTVTLSGPAPAGGAQVTLSSSNTAVASVPSSVTVPAGATSATFTVTTSAVAASTSVTISASYGGVSKTAALTVTPSAPPPLSSLALNPASVVGGAQSSTGTVTLSGPAPAGGAQVTLSSSNTAVASVPSSVTVPAGATSATFTVTTSAVAASIPVTISASYGGVSRTASLTVTPPPPPPLSSLTLDPTSVIGGLQSSTGTVTLSGPAPAGGAQVTLSSSNTAVASVPSSVTVPAGAISATFTVHTSVVLVSTSVNISASANGATRTASLDVTF